MYNKYHAKKTKCVHGHIHDSKKEALRCAELHMLMWEGSIKNLILQKEYVLVPARKYPDMPSERKLSYVADFVYIDTATGKLIVEDTKGYRTKDYIMKRKLFKDKYCKSGLIVFRET